MEHFADWPAGKFPGAELDCACGKRHLVGIRSIRIGSGRLRELPQLLQELGARQVYLLADHNTWKAAGQQAANRMEGMGLPFHGRIFQTEKPLVPDEYAVGSALAAMEPGDDLILAVGSGTLNDTARILSARTGVPYAIVATAPSMDGFASTVSPADLGREEDHQARGVPGGDSGGHFDYERRPHAHAHRRVRGHYRQVHGSGGLAAVPGPERGVLLRGVRRPYGPGRGEVRGKRRRPAPAGRAGGGVRHRGAGALGHRHGHGGELPARLRRGASLCPHLGGGRPGPGGRSTPCTAIPWGVAAVVSASLYELAADLLPEGFQRPDKARILQCLKAAGACADPKALGIRRDLFFESVLHAMEIRERFTILRFLDGKALLPACAVELTNRFYPV